MNRNILDGIVYVLAIVLIVTGIAMKWGAGWALIACGLLLLARLIVPPVYVILRRERSDA